MQGTDAVTSRFDTTGQRNLLETSLGGRMAVHDALGEVLSLHFGEESHHPLTSTLRIERDDLGLESARVLPGNIRVEWQRDAVGRPTAPAAPSAVRMVHTCNSMRARTNSVGRTSWRWWRTRCAAALITRMTRVVA